MNKYAFNIRSLNFRFQGAVEADSHEEAVKIGISRLSQCPEKITPWGIDLRIFQLNDDDTAVEGYWDECELDGARKAKQGGYKLVYTNEGSNKNPPP